MSHVYPKDGWMAFMAEAPIIGIDPMPAYSPDEQLALSGDWMEAYSIYARRGEALIEIARDHESMLEFREDDPDDVDDPDTLFRVRVHADGTLDVFDENQTEPFISFTAHEIFDAFGMKTPT